MVCLIGRNGVGKTTLLKTVIGLLQQKSGRISYQDHELLLEPPYRRARQGIGYVSQGRDIIPQLTVRENLLLGMEALPGGLAKNRHIDPIVFDLFPILEQFLGRKGGDLSGGQQQQLAIARAMLGKPKLLLLPGALGASSMFVSLVDKLKDDYDLLGGNTRLAGLLKKGINPKLWVIDMSKAYKEETKEQTSKMKSNKLKGGLSDKMTISDIAKKHKVDVDQLTKQLSKGMKAEMEHTKDRKKAKEIAMDHIVEDPKYYDKLKKIETKDVTGTGASSGSYSSPVFGDSAFTAKSNAEVPKKVEANEVTGASSSGQYSGPAIWAKSSSPKDWEPSRKPQYKGGEFVKVKGKCKRFPYCNQGDIKALKMWENKNVSEAIKSASKKLNLSETTIKAILQYEMENTKNKRVKLRYLY